MQQLGLQQALRFVSQFSRTVVPLRLALAPQMMAWQIAAEEVPKECLGQVLNQHGAQGMDSGGKSGSGCRDRQLTKTPAASTKP